MSEAENSAPEHREAQVGRPFEKGKSPNPGGRPKGYAEFKTLCQSKTPAAVKALVEALEDPGLKVQASKVLLEFGWGKATQVISGEGGEPVKIIINKLSKED